jgi:SAM-dependent methyltransferase
MNAFDEAAHAGVEHFDPDYVAGYDGKSGMDEEAELELLRRAGLTADTVMVDLGAGTGRTVLLAAPLAREVVAVDVSAPMLARLQGALDARALTNVRIVQAGFLSYDHSGDPPTLVHSRNALHHLPDPQKLDALQRVASLLAPGGRFVLRDLVWSFPRERASEVFERWFDAAPDDPSRGWTRAELEEHVRTEHSPWSDELERMLDDAGLDILEREHRSDTFADYICARR